MKEILLSEIGMLMVKYENKFWRVTAFSKGTNMAVLTLIEPLIDEDEHIVVNLKTLQRVSRKTGLPY